MSVKPTGAVGRPPGTGVRRVAMVIQRFRPAFSGQAVQVEQLCRGLAERGVHSTVITAVRGRSGCIEACDGYEIHRLRADLLPGSADRSRLWMPTYALRVLPALRRARPDVVHVHGPTDGLLSARAYARLTGTPAVAEMTLLGDDDPVSLRDRTMLAAGLRWRSYRRFDAWVAMSEAFLPSSRSAGLPPERVHVIPQAVDTERFRPATPEERASLRRAAELPIDGPVVAFVGTLGRRKGLDLLLDAWSAVRARYPGGRLVLVGGPPQGTLDGADAEIAARLEAATEDIVRTGLRPDPEELLRAADLFVFPTRREGFGTVMIEAMACGLPCVVAELPGITDYVLEGHGDPAGLVVPQDSAADLADAMTRLLDDPERRSALGRRARATVESRFALPAIVDRYLDLYASLLGGEAA